MKDITEKEIVEYIECRMLEGADMRTLRCEFAELVGANGILQYMRCCELAYDRIHGARVALDVLNTLGFPVME